MLRQYETGTNNTKSHLGDSGVVEAFVGLWVFMIGDLQRDIQLLKVGREGMPDLVRGENQSAVGTRGSEDNKIERQNPRGGKGSFSSNKKRGSTKG